MKQKIEATDLRKYRTELPNLYDDSGLDPYEFRLLAHYVRRGHTFESVRTTERVCKMNHATVIRKRESLEEKGFISTWTEEKRGTVHVRVVDMWAENFAKYSGAQVEQGGAQVEQGGAVVEHSGAQVELKKEPINNKQIKKNKVKRVGGGPPPDEINWIDSDYWSENIKRPEIQEFVSVTGWQPGMNQMPIIYEVIWEHKLTKEDMLPYWRAWSGRGHYARNLAWLTEWAATKTIPDRPNGKPKKQNAEYDPDAYTSGEYADFIDH